jgi:hypothetical protein
MARTCSRLRCSDTMLPSLCFLVGPTLGPFQQSGLQQLCVALVYTHLNARSSRVAQEMTSPIFLIGINLAAGGGA